LHIRELNKNDAVNDFFGSVPEEDRAEAFRDSNAVEKLFTLMESNLDTDNDIFYGAWKNDTLVGFIAIVNPTSHTPGIQIEIAPAYHRKGYGYEFLSAILKHLFETESFTYIQYLVMPTNAASIALVEKVGGALQKPGSFIEKLLIRVYHITK
jgi:RimJ/RimL family protein N-acetyltransferase